MFKYMMTQETAKLWGISDRRVQKLYEGNRIDGVVRPIRVWLIPKDSEKPFDRRYKNNESEEMRNG